MKSIYDFFIFRVIIVAFCLFGIASAYTQDLEKECESIYQSLWIDKDANRIESVEKTLEIAKTYIKKCNNIKKKEEVRAFIAKQIPKIEQKIKELEVNNLIETFNKSIPAKNWDLAFASGKDFLSKHPDYILDVSLVLASIGFDRAVENPPIDKYNNEAINYAKTALQLMNEGKVSATGRYGAFQYYYKNEKCPDGVINAIGWMNYTIGYIMFVRQKQTKEAVSYLYKSTQIGCETKNFSEVYRLIGDWYFDEVIKLKDLRVEKLKSTSQETNETKSILALQKGFVNRAVDAYARAYQISSRWLDNSSTPVLRKKLEELQGDFADSYLKTVINTPFIDPATPVVPIPEN